MERAHEGQKKRQTSAGFWRPGRGYGAMIGGQENRETLGAGSQVMLIIVGKIMLGHFGEQQAKCCCLLDELEYWENLEGWGSITVGMW